MVDDGVPQGIVFDIQRFAVHDGPGLRTSVFLKGCALRCHWCQNPEGMNLRIDLWYFEKKCIRCYQCLAVCPEDALSKSADEQGGIVIDRKRCTRCGKCVDICPTRALVFDGKSMTVAEVIEVVRRDRTFYEVSGGGVTLSGGDPLIQHAFAREILTACRREGLHTAVETCLFADPGVVRSMFEAVELWIVDVKLFDPDLHRRHTGEENGRIFSNLEMLATERKTILVRIPLIPGITADAANLRSIARRIAGMHSGQGSRLPVELINYNPLAQDKYRLMGRTYPLGSQTPPFSDAQLSDFRDVLREEGIHVVEES
jgi:pyruvate formate lyase activating enzyme